MLAPLYDSDGKVIAKLPINAGWVSPSPDRWVHIVHTGFEQLKQLDEAFIHKLPAHTQENVFKLKSRGHEWVKCVAFGVTITREEYDKIYG